MRGGQREGRQRDDETMRDEAALGLRVHEWGLNPLFWVSEMPLSVRFTPIKHWTMALRWCVR